MFVQSAGSVALPAPTGGWNAKDNLATMPPTDAIRMDNWIPDTSSVRLRAGDTEYASGLSGNVESLITHVSDSAEKFLAASDGNIYNISASGAVSGTLGTGFTNARWSWDNFGDKTILVNGADTPQSYDGSTLASAGFSGLTVANLNTVSQVRDRLWFTEKDQAWVWYGSIGGVTGALTKFDLSQIATGGHCVRVTKWSRDAGDGMDDLTVFLMSTGQVIVYQGDPSTTFALVGKFAMPAPLGKRCAVQIGGDVVVLTRGGYVPLSAMMGEGDLENRYLSSKIRNAVKEAVDDAGANFGWEAIRTPDSKFLVFNVPLTTNSEYHQHVVNLFNGSWCRFTGREARCFGVFQNQLYFGGSTKVYQADAGLTDASRSGASISATCQQAFTAFNATGQKHITLLRPTIEAGGTATATFAVKADFDTTNVLSNLQTFGATFDTWEQASQSWNNWEQTWDEGAGVNTFTTSADSLGEYHSVVAQLQSNNTFKWFNTALVFKQGGLI